jgi:F0F1-type ATP synthase membrane subunit b/b'
MAVSPNSSDHWRKQAEEMRALANETLDLETKTILMRMAADFDRLAKLAGATPQPQDKSVG